MTRTSIFKSAAACLLMLASQPALARQAAAPQPAPPAPQPAAQPAAPAQAHTAVILAVQGNVQWRPSADAAWRKAEVGATVPEGGSFRTGLRSAVQARIGSGQDFTIDRLGIVTLEQMINAAGTDQTRIDIESGRILFNITATEFANDVQIRAPDATLAVRGTFGGLEVAVGFATLAYGLLGNDGEFTIEFIRSDRPIVGAMGAISAKKKSGSVGKINKNSVVSSDATSPPQYQHVIALIDTGDPRSRESDEVKAMRRAPGGSTFLISAAGGIPLGVTNPILTSLGLDSDADGKLDFIVIFVAGIEAFQFTVN